MRLFFAFSVAILLATIQMAQAGEHGHSHEGGGNKLQEACKVECPSAKSDHEAHDCLRKLVKKKDSKLVADSDCSMALKTHEAEEKARGHGKKKHAGHKH